MVEMKATRRTVLGAIVIAAAGCVHRPSGGVTLDEVVRRHVGARGGAAVLDRVRACRIDVEIDERGQVLQGRYAADVSGVVRVDIYAQGALVYSEGVDAGGVWLWPKSEPAPRASTATGSANALLNGADGHLFGLHRYPERGHRLRLMPTERIDGVDHPVVEVAFTTGHVSYLYFDPATLLIVRRRDERAYHPDLSQAQQRIETRFSDFRDVDGALYAFRDIDVDLDTGALLATHQAIRRQINPDLPAGVFDRSFEPPPTYG